MLEAINRELHQIGPLVSDWALWTETYEFAKGENPDYVEEDLDDGATRAGMQMNYLGIYDASGAAVWVQSYDSQRRTAAGAGSADR